VDETGVDAGSDLAGALRDLDLARMTPIEALNALHDLQSRLDNDG
jgi:DNA mismatch repair protein MutS